MGCGWVGGGGGDGLGAVEGELRWVLRRVRVVVGGWSRHLEFGRHGDDGVEGEVRRVRMCRSTRVNLLTKHERGRSVTVTEAAVKWR